MDYRVWFIEGILYVKLSGNGDYVGQITNDSRG